MSDVTKILLLIRNSSVEGMCIDGDEQTIREWLADTASEMIVRVPLELGRNMLFKSKEELFLALEEVQEVSERGNSPTPPSPHVVGPTLEDFATRLFDLHGFMLLETYRDKPAVTITFPDLKQAQQFHDALVELSTHRPRPRSLLEGSDNG